ncbi:SusC/RagA family TonB-linked outer membrane protein [Parapedobacter koreensis]|nr:SusC/RagA family TonB-linked outer membrane protein [Parapedobacter koreensis]
MKLTVFLTLMTVLQVSAAVNAQTISLEVRDMPLPEVMERIQAQSGYLFFLQGEKLAKMKVSARIQQVELREAMDMLTDDLGLEWVLKGKTIILRPAPPTVVQQQRVIQGTVVDSLNSPLEGVTVTVKGTSRATTTDSAGRYRLTLPAQDNALVFSMVGFQPTELAIGESDMVNATLHMLTSDINEVVVIGYGTTTKQDLTAAVSSISQEALGQRTMVSLADAMRGKAAGVQISQDDGTPGSAFTFRIRGASSISAGSTPLFVIDGVLQDNADNINPGDVESIEILKDASGTAMYGARGANGVVMITTKSGKAGRTNAEFYSNLTVQTPSRQFPVMDAQEFARARFLASAYVFSPPSASDPNVPANVLPEFTYFRDTPLGEPGGFWGVAQDALYHDWENYGSPDSINTNWQDAMFQHSLVQEYRLNISGGTEKTKFSLMGGYLGQGGLVVFSDYERLTGRFNLQQQLSPAINMTLNLSGDHSATNGFIAGSLNGGVVSNTIVTAMLAKPPTEPLTQSDVEDNVAVDDYITTNPYSLAKYVTNNRYPTNWLARLSFDAKLNKQFTYKITGTYSTTNVNTDAYYPKFTGSGSRFNGRAYLSRGTTTKLMNENLLYYKNQFGDSHRINAVAGATFERQRINLVTAENQNYDIEILGVYGLQNGTVPIIPTYNITEWTMASFFGRAEYSYKGKYLLTGTFRADGSSRFSRSSKWGYFPSAAIAWNIFQEDFMENVHAISNLKLRASIGQSGNTAIPSYLTLSTIGTYFSPMDGNTPNYGVVVERPENLALKWETTTQVNTGLDVGLLDNRVNLTAEWYLKRTRDLLIQKVTPGYSGYRSTWTNLGAIQNSGVELTLSTTIFDKPDFAWNLDANIGFNRSKALEVGADLGLDPGVVPGVGNSAFIRNGQPIGQWYGYVTDGIYQSYEEILSSGLRSINGQAIAAVRPGTRRFIDQNGDGVIDANDRVVLGTGQPDFMGGLTNLLQYKQFSLNTVITYSYGNQVYNANRVALEHGRNINNMSKGPADAWRPSLYDLNTGALVETGNPTNVYRMPGGPEELLMLSDWVEDGSFIRLSDVTLSYNLGNNGIAKLKRFGISGLTVFASGKNLWVWTDYSGYDPEVNTRQGNFGDLMPSLDYASYPRSRMYALGFRLSF